AISCISMAAPPQPQRLLSDTIRSNKGKVLVYDGDGFEYRSYHIRKDGIELFRCNKGGCKGKAKHENGQVTRYEDHNGHVPPDHSNEIRFVRKAARHDRASGVPTDQVMAKYVFNIYSDEPFLRHDTCANLGQNDPEALKIFVTNDGLDKRRTGLDWGVDGTFHSAPANFVQVFIIGVMDQHLFTPILYAFLTGKSTRPYECVFQWLSAQGVPSPLTITSDFERAITSAIRSVYPMVSIQYCIFHLYKNMYAKIQASYFYSSVSYYIFLFINLQSLGLSKLYASPSKKYFKGIMALSMIDINDVHDYYEELKAELLSSVSRALSQKVQDFIVYIETTYVGVLLANGGRTQPMFPVALWNARNRILNGQQMGNSCVESYNARLKASFILNFEEHISLQCVNPNSSCNKVSVQLFRHQKMYKGKADQARLSALTLSQQFPQAAATLNYMNRRKNAVSNGPLNQSRLDYLYALTVYVSID
uniref:MULE domain-containing protein n=1 Tax=Pristionchus pacificus TaxID=54126 RepID=A0A2A6D1I9_PRIPA